MGKDRESWVWQRREQRLQTSVRRQLLGQNRLWGTLRRQRQGFSPRNKAWRHFRSERRLDGSLGVEGLELISDTLDVLLELGALGEGRLSRTRAGAVGVEHGVLDVRDHDEVANGDLVAGNEFATVVSKVHLSELVDFAGDALTESRDQSRLVSRGSSEHLEKTAHQVTEGIDDGVSVAGLVPVLGVVVAEADAEGAEHGAHLTDLDLLAILLEVEDGERVELTTDGSHLVLGPVSLHNRVLRVGLSVVLEHLVDGVGTASTVTEVGPVDHADATGFLSGGRLFTVGA